MPQNDSLPVQKRAAPIRVSVDFVADIVCPWCYIGKRNLEIAAARLEHEVELSFTWRPFQLDTSIPQEGYPRNEYLRAKFGSDRDRLQAMRADIEQAAQASGIALNFDRIDRYPNTADLHRIIQWARSGEGQWRASEMLFAAYWLAGADLTDRVLLVAIACELGLEGELVERLLQSDEGMAALEQDLQAAKRMGIQGVPAYIFDGKYLVVGAHPPEHLVSAIKRAAMDNVTKSDAPRVV